MITSPAGLSIATPVKAMCDRRRNRPISPRKGSVRRALFGPVDHEEVKKNLDQQMAIIKAADSQRWNFDFSGESPLPGRFDWERVDEYSPGDIPSAYAMSCLTVSATEEAVPIRYTNSRFVSDTTTAGVKRLRGEDDEEAVPATTDNSESNETSESRTQLQQQQRTLQAKIPEFFPAVKRRTTETAESPAKRRRVHLSIHQRATESL